MMFTHQMFEWYKVSEILSKQVIFFSTAQSSLDYEASLFVATYDFSQHFIKESLTFVHCAIAPHITGGDI